MISDATAARLADTAIRTVCNASATDGEIAALVGCSLHETGFGYYWKGDGVGSFNQGAIQCGGWTGKRFTYRDTHPNADGTSTGYSACFRAYDREPAGWEDLVRVMYCGRRAPVREAARRSDWHGVSAAMHASRYYEGYGKTVEDRIRNHERAMLRGINRALVVLGASIVVPPSAAPSVFPTLRFGAIGEDVKRAQRELRLAADGIFGRITLAAVKSYQRDHGLLDDGVVGKLTWAALMADDYIPIAA